MKVSLDELDRLSDEPIVEPIKKKNKSTKQSSKRKDKPNKHIDNKLSDSDFE